MTRQTDSCGSLPGYLLATYDKPDHLKAGGPHHRLHADHGNELLSLVECRDLCEVDLERRVRHLEEGEARTNTATSVARSRKRSVPRRGLLQRTLRDASADYTSDSVSQSCNGRVLRPNASSKPASTFDTRSRRHQHQSRTRSDGGGLLRCRRPRLLPSAAHKPPRAMVATG